MYYNSTIDFYTSVTRNKSYLIERICVFKIKQLTTLLIKFLSLDNEMTGKLGSNHPSAWLKHVYAAFDLIYYHIYL